MTTKTCKKCGKEKDVSGFYEQKHHCLIMKDGTTKWIGPRYKTRCRKCVSEANKKRRDIKNGFKQFFKSTYKIPCKGSLTLTQQERQIKTGLKYTLDSPIKNLKKCLRCKKYQPQENFREKNNICKPCRSREHKEKYIPRPRKRRDPEEQRKRENEKLKKYFKIYGRSLRLLSGDGCCLYCWETNLFMLNNHHIWGRNNDNFTITLCENHHAAFTRRVPLVLEGWHAPQETKKSNR